MKRRSTATLHTCFKSIAERFASLTQVAYDGVLIYDSGVVLDATPGAAALFGRGPTDLNQIAVEDLVDLDSHSALIQHLGSAVRKTCPAIALREDGSKVPIEMSVQGSLTVNGRRVQIVALRDASGDDRLQYRTDRSFRRRCLSQISSH